MAPEHGAPSGARSRYSEPVAIRVFKVTLPAGKTLFIDWNPELLRNGVDVTDVQVDKGVGRCITCVLREIKPNASARYGNEPWKTRLELMLPLFQESESLVPGHGAIGVLHIQDWDHLLVHASPAYPGHSQQRLCLGQCSGMAPDGKGQLVRAFIGRFGGWLIFPIIVAIAIATAPFIGSGVALYALMLVVAFILVLTFRQLRYRR